MNKIEFNNMGIPEQIKHINELLLSGQSLRNISGDLSMSKTTLRDRAAKIGYGYDASLKQYIKAVEVNNLVNKKVIKTNTKHTNTILDEKLDHRLDHRPEDSLNNKLDNKLVFSIPIKPKDKTNTKAFNVVMDLILVDRLDHICKLKGGYSRNEVINIMCQWCADNLEK